MGEADAEQRLATASSWLGDADRVAVLTGAGVSAESGIPTFRGAGGLWRGRDPLSLATPEAFAADPALVWEFYRWRRDLVGRSRPNPAHLALAEAEARAPSLTLVTQNVDRLHQQAGSRAVVELHGNLWDVRCVGCGRTFDRSGVELSPLPRCEDCGALLRPAVVWFGESLPHGALSDAATAVNEADVLLVVGTSAVVYPAAGLIGAAARAGRRVIEVNLEPTAASREVDLALFGPAGTVLPRLLDKVGR